MKSLISLNERGIFRLEWDQPNSSANLLSLSFLEEMNSLMDQIEREQPKALVLISKKANVFCAGADIKEIQKIQTKEEMRKILDKAHKLLNRLERLSAFKIAAIHGSCLGGGLELALRFDFRLLSDSPSTRLGLPETRLGLIPALGASLRLPQLIGLRRALPLALTGKSLSAKQAIKIGLAEELAPASLLEKRAWDLAEEFARRPEAFFKKSYREKAALAFWAERALKPLIGLLAKRRALKKSKGFSAAPLKILELIQKAYGPFSPQNLEEEKEAFCDLFQTPSAKSLMRIFLLADRAKNLPALKKAQNGQAIERVGVLGAGVMGRAIACLFADKGFKVRLIDNSHQSLCAASGWAKKFWKSLSPYERERKMARLSLSPKLWGLSSLDLLIEALPEKRELKREAIANVSQRLKPECLFASNSSSLSLRDLAQASLRPENFFGLHFFNPAHKMPLAEVSLKAGQKESLWPSIKPLLRRLGKIPLLVKDSPGFIVNRLLAGYLLEALWLFEEGLDIKRADYCYRERFGMPLGPFQLMDKIGLDICLKTLAHLAGAGLSFELPKLAGDLQVLGLGEKSQSGFYIYRRQKFRGREKPLSQGPLNEKVRLLRKSPPKSPVSDEEIIQRGIYRMINEGQKLLRDQIAASAEDIDLALVLGAGFPPFLGGPMNYGKHLGFANIRKKLEEFAARYGPRFEPCF